MGDRISYGPSRVPAASVIGPISLAGIVTRPGRTSGAPSFPPGTPPSRRITIAGRGLVHAQHPHARLGLRRARLVVLRGPVPVRAQREAGVLRGLTALLPGDEPRPGAVVLVEAKELGEIDPRQSRRTFDLEQVLVVVEDGVAAHVRGAAVDDGRVRLRVDDDELVVNDNGRIGRGVLA